MRGLCVGGPLMNQWAFQKQLDVICKARLESFGFKSPSNNLQIKTGGFSMISNLPNLHIALHKKNTAFHPPMSPSDREENHYKKPSITIPALDRRPIRSQFKDDSINSLLLRWADCSRTAASLPLNKPELRGDHFLNLREEIRWFNHTHMAWIMPLCTHERI